MTNPFKQFEHEMLDHDYLLQQEERINPVDPAAMKALMEVYRDTANQLNAQTLRLEQERSELHDVERDLQISNDLNEELKIKLKELEAAKKFAENASTLLDDDLADYKKRFEKIYRHRDELAEKVKKARATRTELSEWIEKHEAGMTQMDVDDALKHTLHRLHEDLGANPAQEEDDF